MNSYETAVSSRMLVSPIIAHLDKMGRKNGHICLAITLETLQINLSKMQFSLALHKGHISNIYYLEVQNYQSQSSEWCCEFRVKICSQIFNKNNLNILFMYFMYWINRLCKNSKKKTPKVSSFLHKDIKHIERMEFMCEAKLISNKNVLFRVTDPGFSRRWDCQPPCRSRQPIIQPIFTRKPHENERN